MGSENTALAFARNLTISLITPGDVQAASSRERNAGAHVAHEKLTKGAHGGASYYSASSAGVAMTLFAFHCALLSV